jgi:hypothetical protein
MRMVLSARIFKPNESGTQATESSKDIGNTNSKDIGNTFSGEEVTPQPARRESPRDSRSSS